MKAARLSLLFFLLVNSTVTISAGENWLYTVKPGDTLSGVSGAYLEKTGDWRKLGKLNRVAEPRHLPTGKSLRLPVDLLKQQSAFAEVVWVQGEAWQTRNGQTLPVAQGARLAVGTLLKTAAGSNLTLRFTDGSRLLMTQNSQLTLARLMTYGKTGMTQTAVHLREGALDTQVSPQVAPAARYQIESQALNLGVRGTDFRVSVANDGLTHSEVLGGRVMASGAAAAVALDAGYGTYAAPGQPPSAPVKLLAAPHLDGLQARLEKLPLRFAWQADAAARRYRARIVAQTAAQQVALEGVFDAAQAKWADLPDGAYVLRVRGIDEHGLEGFEASHAFVLKARPEAPHIVAPQDGKTAHGEETAFHWTQPANAASYHLQVATTADFAQPLFDIDHLAGNAHHLAVAPGRYFWRIASITASGDQGPYSDPQGYEQRKVPHGPGEISLDESDGNLDFRWKAGEAGQHYQAQLSRQADFGKVEKDIQVDVPHLRITHLDPGLWFMRIRTVDSDGFAGPYGAAQQFEAPAAPLPAWLLIFVPLLLSL